MRGQTLISSMARIARREIDRQTVRSRSAGCKHRKTETGGGLPSRSLPRYRCKAQVSAFAKATARQSSLSFSTRAKTGGKGIRTPDFQLAKLALYQLSYAPCELSSLDCGSRIANKGAHSCRTFAVSGNANPDADLANRHPAFVRLERSTLRSCAREAVLFSLWLMSPCRYSQIGN